MKRIKTLALVLGLAMMICGCGSNSGDTVSEPETTTTTTTTTTETTTDTTADATTDATTDTTADTTTDTSESEELPETEEVTVEPISDEQALEAVRNYCCTTNPDLESIASEGYSIYWEIISSDDSEIVVMFRSYTGAQVRYYIDRATGITNATEFVPGITEEEEPTGDSFNIRDYIN